MYNSLLLLLSSKLTPVRSEPFMKRNFANISLVFEKLSPKNVNIFPTYSRNINAENYR